MKHCKDTVLSCEIKKNYVQKNYSSTKSCFLFQHIESRTLAIAQNLSQQLQTTCLTLVSSIQGLPQNIQDQVHHVGEIAGDVYKSFRSASSFREVSDNLLTSSKGQLKKMKESLDDVMDYLVNNTPLNWLVGPFYPQLAGSLKGEHKGEGDKKTNQENKRPEEKEE